MFARSAVARSRSSGESDVDRFERFIEEAVASVAPSRTAPRILSSLRNSGFLEPRELADADLRELEQTLELEGLSVGPKGIQTLMRLAAWFERNREALEFASRGAMDEFRTSLREINGIGSATADRLILFGLGLPTYPVDRATARISLRHGWLDESAEVDDLRSTITDLADEDAARLMRLSESMERIARVHCRSAHPECEGCPLRSFLPESGPILPF
ncbi:MAG: hypothetical protein SFX72_01135 [Isosphaeraceae bacterium]|nr:hypothetical protein [Isosphaeraceae bacterium]